MSGLWRRKSSEKSSAESESSGSVSSYSERFSDEQGVFRSSPTESSPNHAHSPEISSINEGNEEHETVKSLTEKLSTALLDVAAKETLVKQHAKVTDEAISGWEAAEAEVAALRRQLDASSHKNSALEDKTNQLDEALKECVRQLRQSREEQEKKVRNALAKAHEWESHKSQLETQIKELHGQLETARTEAFVTSFDKSFYSRLESLEKENMSLKTELLTRSDQLRICMLERDLSTRAAESASKQHLESIKKVTKLESECRRLRSVESRTSSFQIPFSSTLSGAVYENESLNSWASALIVELDQFKQEKASSDITALTEVDLMDDFLEMERLVATPETDHDFSMNNLKCESARNSASEKSVRNELEALHLRLAELEKNIAKMENEKGQLKVALAESQIQIETSCNQLALADDELVDLQSHLRLANESKQAAMAEAAVLEAKRKETESQLEMTHLEIMKLSEKVEFLQGELENTLSKELEKNIEFLEATRKELQSQLNSAFMQAEELRELVRLLEEKLEEESALCVVYSAKAEANETAREELDIQLMSAKSELRKSNNTIEVLEIEIKEERSLSSKLADRAEMAEAAISSLESQLESARSEAERLHTELRCLQEKLEKETALGAEHSAKCLVLEEELSRRKKSAEQWRITSSNGTGKLNKEKELAEAAGKLAECQKTIASLGRQIKSLTNIDEFILEGTKTNPLSDECLPYLSFSGSKTFHPNGFSEDSDWSRPPVFSSSPALPGLERLLSRSRSSDHVENP